jgi:hypothetical protein
VLSQILRDHHVDCVTLKGTGHRAQPHAVRIPREDLVSFVAVMVSHADVLALHNRELLQRAVEQQGSFECVTPEESVARLEVSVV